MVEQDKGTPENPLTREDVQKWKAQFLHEASSAVLPNPWPLGYPLGDVLYFYLNGKTFKDGVFLGRETFAGKLQRGENQWKWATDFGGAELHNVNFDQADLHDANFSSAVVTGAHFWQSKLHGVFGANSLIEANIEFAEWSPDFKVGEELSGHHPETIYRALKQWYTNNGMYDTAGKFFYREIECKRKQARKDKKWVEWVKLGFYRFLFGYGERPWRLVRAGFLVWFGFAGLYALCGILWGLVPIDFWHVLYVSGVSFTALGYGPWFSADSLREGAQGLATFESFIGIFMLALFLVTFTRKMTR